MKQDYKLYRRLTEAVLKKKLDKFIEEENISIGLLALMLQCSESYIKLMAYEKEVPTVEWLSKASSGMYFATGKYRPRRTTKVT